MPSNYDYFFQGAPANLSPAEVAQQMAQTQNLQQMAAKNQMTLKTMAQQQSEDEATRQALSQSVNPDGTINRQAALSKLASNPQTAMTANKLYHTWMSEDIALNKSGNEAMKAEREAKAARLKEIGDEAALIGQITSGVKDQASYDVALKYAASKKMDVSGFPAQYDPGLVSQYQNRALTVKDQADNELKRLKLEQPLTDIAKLQADLKAGRIDQATYNMMLAKMTTHAPAVQVSFGQPHEGTDPVTGKPVMYAVDKTGEVKMLPIGPKAGSGKGKVDYDQAINVLDDADKLIKKAPGSFIEAGLSTIGSKGLGISTEASQSQAQLQALQAALMMRMPRMEGPQSDKDVALYREQAGRIGDPTVPAGDKKAAIKTIRTMLNRYKNSSTTGVSGGSQPTTKVNPANGKTYYQHPDGNFYLQPPSGGQ